MSAPGAKSKPAPPDRLRLVEAKIASVYCSGDPYNRDPITHMIWTTLNDNRDMNLEDSIIVKMKLNISSPEEYSGSSDLKVYKTFVAGILWWLKMNSLLGTKHAAFQVECLGTRLKSNTLEWYTRNVKRHDRPIETWSLESIFEGLQKCFLITLMH